MPRLTVRGINANWETEGSGPVNICLIHGMGDSTRMWWNQLKPFTRDYRVIMYDVRGHGATDRPKNGYAISELVEDIYELYKASRAQIAGDLDAHGDLVNIMKPPVWLGYSMGGRIVAHLAVSHPDVVKALVLANSNPNPSATPTPEFQKRREEQMALLRKGDMKRWAEMATTNAFSPDFRQKDPKAFDQYMRVKLASKADGILRVMEGMGASTAKINLGDIKVPTLVIVGEHDPGTNPEVGKQLQTAIPGSKLVVLPTGHAAAIEAPDRFSATVLDFIKSLPA